MPAVPAALWSVLPDEPMVNSRYHCRRCSHACLLSEGSVGDCQVSWPMPTPGRVQCRLCAHNCVIAQEATGRCRVRWNHNSALYSLVADHVTAAHLDPVEKKPLFHFLPGSATFSVGTEGCNMTCAFCQNHDLSQRQIPPDTPIGIFPASLPRRLVETARTAGAASIAYTYNEPTIFFEMLEPTARMAQENGLDNILVSNAYQSRECLDALRPLIQAANFDLKSFSNAFYREHCGARLRPVLNTLRTAMEFGWWVEITTLLIPGLNDSDEELRAIARFIKSDLGPDVPWHISRFRPMFRMLDRPPTPLASLERALTAGREEGLHFVYAGNVPGHDSESTRCPACHAVAIPRTGYEAPANATGHCPACDAAIPGVWAARPSTVPPKDQT